MTTKSLRRKIRKLLSLPFESANCSVVFVEVRGKKGFSPREMAERLGDTPTRIESIEKGESLPSVSLMKKLLALTGARPVKPTDWELEEALLFLSNLPHINLFFTRKK